MALWWTTYKSITHLEQTIVLIYTAYLRAERIWWQIGSQMSQEWSLKQSLWARLKLKSPFPIKQKSIFKFKFKLDRSQFIHSVPIGFWGTGSFLNNNTADLFLFVHHQDQVRIFIPNEIFSKI